MPNTQYHEKDHCHPNELTHMMTGLVLIVFIASSESDAFQKYVEQADETTIYL